MADPFEKELEELVGKYARELTREITSIILRRLGVTGASAPLRRAPSAKRPAAGRKPAAPAAAPRAASRRTRSSAEEKTAAEEKIARIVVGSSGMSSGEIERASGLPRSAVGAALKALKDEGRVFMGGTRRFARYAGTQAAAEKASQEARGG